MRCKLAWCVGIFGLVDHSSSYIPEISSGSRRNIVLFNLIGCFVCGADEMGCCVSTSSRSTCSSGSHGEAVSPLCFEIGFCGTKRTKRTFSDHVIALQNLPSVPNRIFTNGKSRTSCIFTQQGRKGINQDAMIVWEVSFRCYFEFEFLWF